MTDREVVDKRINLELRLFAVLKEKSQLRLEILEEKLAEIDSLQSAGEKQAWTRNFVTLEN